MITLLINIVNYIIYQLYSTQISKCFCSLLGFRYIFQMLVASTYSLLVCCFLCKVITTVMQVNIFICFNNKVNVSFQNWPEKILVISCSMKTTECKKGLHDYRSLKKGEKYLELPEVGLSTYNHTGTNYTDWRWLDRIKNKFRSPWERIED